MKSNARITNRPILTFENYTIYWIISEPEVNCIITNAEDPLDTKLIGNGLARCRVTDDFDAIFGMKKSLERAASLLPREKRRDLFYAFGNIYGFGECVGAKIRISTAMIENAIMAIANIKNRSV